MQSAPVDRYSSEVSLTLLIDGQALRVWQVGPEMLILKDRLATTTREATLIITVDGRERRQAVVLPQGLAANQEEVRYF
jgi:hypothetical protein